MDTIAVLDFGGQYSHLIARRIREKGVYSVVMDPAVSTSGLKNIPDLKGVILSGGSSSVYDSGSPKCDRGILSLGIPILGICYGHQLIAFLDSGKVRPGDSGEYGTTRLTAKFDSPLLENIDRGDVVWMNHRDIVEDLPVNYGTIASTKNTPVAAFEDSGRRIYGVQFHPEVSHTKKGDLILDNFIFGVCRAQKNWDEKNIIGRMVAETSERIRDKKAIVALSGGVDSSVAAVIAGRAIGKNLVAVYVDTGLMRRGETEFIKNAFADRLNLKIIDAQDKFFSALKGVTDPEQKRKIIGNLFIEIFTQIAEEEGAEFLVQGTIYSDRIESGVTKNSSSIKSHHNVGGLPKNMRLKLHEPLRELYKDEVRKIAGELGLPREITGRQVFPGPGMSIRILGEVTPENAEIIKKANSIVEEEMISAGLYDKVWMSFAVLLPLKSVGIQGDSRTYKRAIAVRVVESKDAMTANFSRVPYDVLEKISTRITNEIKEVNRVVYDISNKPPATMEWE